MLGKLWTTLSVFDRVFSNPEQQFKQRLYFSFQNTR